MNICENYRCLASHLGLFGSGRFCSQRCSSSFSSSTNRKETNKKISRSLEGRTYLERRIRVSKTCLVCFSLIEGVPSRVNKRKYCSSKCAGGALKERGVCRKAGLASVAAQAPKRSKNEIYFANLCLNSFEEVLCNKAMFNGWDADVILPEVKVAVLWNGKWHYEKITERHSLAQVQCRDKLKIKAIEECGFLPYIVKDMGRYSTTFVEKQFTKFLSFVRGGC